MDLLISSCLLPTPQIVLTVSLLSTHVYWAMGDQHVGLGAFGPQRGRPSTWRQADLGWRPPEFMSAQLRTDRICWSA